MQDNSDDKDKTKKNGQDAKMLAKARQMASQMPAIAHEAELLVVKTSSDSARIDAEAKEKHRKIKV